MKASVLTRRQSRDNTVSSGELLLYDTYTDGHTMTEGSDGPSYAPLTVGLRPAEMPSVRSEETDTNENR